MNLPEEGQGVAGRYREDRSPGGANETGVVEKEPISRSERTGYSLRESEGKEKEIGDKLSRGTIKAWEKKNGELGIHMTRQSI